MSSVCPRSWAIWSITWSFCAGFWRKSEGFDGWASTRARMICADSVVGCRLLDVELEFVGADLERVALGERHPAGDAVAVDERAVARAGVLDVEAAASPTMRAWLRLTASDSR